MEVVHDGDAALHYEFDLAEDGDVPERVPLDGDEVGRPFEARGKPVETPFAAQGKQDKRAWRGRWGRFGESPSAKDEMVSSMGESAEFKPGFLASLGMTRCGGRGVTKDRRMAT